MRCPFCGGLNQERAAFCVNCGRDLRNRATPPVPQRPTVPPHQANPTSQPASRGTTPSASAQPPRGAPGVSLLWSEASTQAAQTRNEPAAPGVFPPRTLDQLNALLAPGAQPYTVAESSLGSGKRRLVRIVFAPCAGWQQAATLLKALRELPDENVDSIVIQGIQERQPGSYAFTNGQLQFDRSALLGSRVSRRYIIETENGLSYNSLRFVINE